MDHTTNATSDDSETVKISLPWIWRPVKRRMLPGCELFRDGDAAMHVARKLVPLENEDTDKESANSVKETIPCSVVGCNQMFTSLLSCENHYKSAHCHSCVTCHRTFPSAFLLDIHIQENHDPLFAVLASRQDMYRCLVESCSDKFSAPDPRRQHMVTVHRYPANFRLHRLRPTDQSRKKEPTHSKPAARDMDDKPSPTLKQNENSQGDAHNTPTTLTTSHPCVASSDSPSDKENTEGAEAMLGVEGRGEGEEKEEGMEVSEAEKNAPRRVFVHKVPQNFSFGHGVGRGFHRPPGKKKGKKKGGHWHQRVGDDSGETTTTNIENVDMKDMADALSDAV